MEIWEVVTLEPVGCAAAAAAGAAAVADCSADWAETADLWDSEGKPEAAEADAAVCAEAKVGLED